MSNAKQKLKTQHSDSLKEWQRTQFTTVSGEDFDAMFAPGREEYNRQWGKVDTEPMDVLWARWREENKKHYASAAAEAHARDNFERSIAEVREARQRMRGEQGHDGPSVTEFTDLSLDEFYKLIGAMEWQHEDERTFIVPQHQWDTRAASKVQTQVQQQVRQHKTRNHAKGGAERTDQAAVASVESDAEDGELHENTDELDENEELTEIDWSHLFTSDSDGVWPRAAPIDDAHNQAAVSANNTRAPQSQSQSQFALDPQSDFESDDSIATINSRPYSSSDEDDDSEYGSEHDCDSGLGFGFGIRFKL